MAVGKIEYKKILKDENLTPTKLKDLYVSKISEDSFANINDNFAESPEERYTIITPEAAAALIANRQKQPSSTEIEKPEENKEVETSEETPVQEPVMFTPLEGGIWPIITNSESSSSTTNFANQGDFVRKMTNVYKTELQNRGYDPAFAEYIVAQDGLESAWGKSQSGKNNFGGIKGKGTSKRTKEWNGSQMIDVTDSFRDFNDLKDYVNYKINLVGNNRYNVFAYSPEEYFERMKAGGYATDPNYVSKLNSVLQTVRKYS